MRKHGFAVSKDQDIFTKLLEPERSKLFSALFGASRGPGVDPSKFVPPTIAPAKIDAFRAFELKIANADADCRPQPDIDALVAIRVEYEQPFIEEKRALLN